VSPERQWWLRTLAVFQSPRAVFAALRDDSDEQAAARQEPVLALVLLAGVAGVLSTGPIQRLLDDPAVDDLLVVAILVFIAGGLYGIASYWLGGAFLHTGLRGAGGRGTFRRARHLLAFAAAPLALSFFVVWPLRLAIYGSDTFRTGGSDEGAGPLVFEAVAGAFVLWSAALLVLGVRVVHGWTWARALVAVALTVLAVTAVTALILLPLTAS
jgi:hypothetical protein